MTTHEKIKYFTLPNIITLLNLLSGSIAVFIAIEMSKHSSAIDLPKHLAYASYFIGLAMVFDFLDGFVARKLNQVSPIGKQLDSLADLVSFGIAPAAIIYQLLKYSLYIDKLSSKIPLSEWLILLTPTILILFSALRLAKFTIDKRQSDEFLGMPTPAVAAFVASIPLIMEFNLTDLMVLSGIFDTEHANLCVVGVVFVLKSLVLEDPWFYIPMILVLSTLLVVELPMFSLKFHDFSFRRNRIRYVFLGLSLFFFVLFQVIALPFIILSYVYFSIVKVIIDTTVETKIPHKGDRFKTIQIIEIIKLNFAHSEVMVEDDMIDLKINGKKYYLVNDEHEVHLGKEYGKTNYWITILFALVTFVGVFIWYDGEPCRLLTSVLITIGLTAFEVIAQVAILKLAGSGEDKKNVAQLTDLLSRDNISDDED